MKKNNKPVYFHESFNGWIVSLKYKSELEKLGASFA